MGRKETTEHICHILFIIASFIFSKIISFYKVVDNANVGATQNSIQKKVIQQI